MSRSDRNILSILAMAAGIVVCLRSQTKKPSKSVNQILDKLDKSANEGFELWAGQLDKREIQSIFERLQEFELNTIPRNGRITIWTSAVLGLLSDCMDHVRNEYRLAVLWNVHREVKALHRYYDKRTDQWDVYEQARNAIEVWERMAA